MGNQTSSSSSSSPIDIERLRPFSRYVGTLGLSRHELDKCCQPSGLYGSCQWEDKAIRRLIADGRIAARLKGEECLDSTSGATEECPICFLLYTDINTTTCCNASMCTECYLQVSPQKEKQSTCPFCNCVNFSVVLAKKKNLDIQGVCPSETSSCVPNSSDTSSTTSSTCSTGNSKKNSTACASMAPKTTGFGSELEKDERFRRMRKRSESFASSEGADISTPKSQHDIIQSIAMTADERQRLEEEMKAQHNHPLVLRLEAEAQERRMENDRAYRSSNASSNSQNRQTNDLSPSYGYNIARRYRNWDQLNTYFDQAEEIGEMTAFETAILYSRMAEVVAAEEYDEHRSAGTNSSDNGSSTNSNREQLEGFPLLRSLLTGQLDIGHGSVSSGRSLNLRSSRRQRNPLMRSNLESVTLDTATMMMRGISEEEQISMAIAASMQDQQSADSSDDDDDDDGNDDSNDDSNNDANDDGNEADGGDETGTINSNSENNSHAGSNSDNIADLSEDSSSSPSITQVPGAGSQQLKQQGSGGETSTITELARVVTDAHTPNTDTILNGIAA